MATFASLDRLYKQMDIQAAQYDLALQRQLRRPENYRDQEDLVMAKGMANGYLILKEVLNNLTDQEETMLKMMQFDIDALDIDLFWKPIFQRMDFWDEETNNLKRIRKEYQ